MYLCQLPLASRKIKSCTKVIKQSNSFIIFSYHPMYAFITISWYKLKWDHSKTAFKPCRSALWMFFLYFLSENLSSYLLLFLQWYSFTHNFILPNNFPLPGNMLKAQLAISVFKTYWQEMLQSQHLIKQFFRWVLITFFRIKRLSLQ